MSTERTGRAPHVFGPFPGYYRAGERNDYHVPEGTLTPNSRNFVVTDRGTLRKGFGSSLISTSSISVGPKQMFYWRRPKGGPLLIVEGVNSLLALSPGPPQGLWSPLLGDSSITSGSKDQRDRIGSFVSYGDFLFYANGVDRPKKIFRHNLKAFELGLTPPEQSHLPTRHHVNRQVFFGRMGLSAGVYQYAFTFTYVAGGESNESTHKIEIDVPGTFSDETFISRWMEPVSRDQNIRQMVVFDGLPTFNAYPSDAITHLNVYRTQSHGSEFFRIRRIPRGYRSFIDDIPDSRLGVAVPLDHDRPPIARLLEFFDDRLWTVGSVGEGAADLIRYSRKGFPDIWPPGFVIPQSEWVNAGELTGVRAVAGVLYFLFERAVFRLEGSRPEEYRLVVVSSSLGCVAPQSLRVYRDQLVFLSQLGVVVLQGIQSQVIELPISRDLEEVHFQDWKNACAAVIRNQYVLTIPSTYEQPTDIGFTNRDAANLTRVLVLNLTSGGIGLIDDHFDVATDSGPEGYPVVARFTKTFGQGDGQDTERPRILGYGTKRYGAHGANLFAWEFNWTALGDPARKKVLDSVELDVLSHGINHFDVSIEDENGRIETRLGGTDFSSDALPEWGTSNWSTTETYPEQQLFTVYVRTEKLEGRRFRLRITEKTISPSHHRVPVELLQVRFYSHPIDRQ